MLSHASVIKSVNNQALPKLMYVTAAMTRVSYAGEESRSLDLSAHNKKTIAGEFRKKIITNLSSIIFRCAKNLISIKYHNTNPIPNQIFLPKILMTS